MTPTPLLQTADSPLVDLIRPSPNHGERRTGTLPDGLILHYTGMADGPSAIDWLCNPASQVSCHYLVEEDGRIVQLVSEQRRAWHAGRSFWAGETDLNSVSLGIEVVNAGHPGGLPVFPDRQIEAVTRLCRDLIDRYAIAPQNVLAHSDIAPGRKIDPGEHFPWQRLYANGVGLWVQAHDGPDGGLTLGDAGDGVRLLQSTLVRYGYGLDVTGAFDGATETVVRAFQLHFRPARVSGTADAGTLRTLDELWALRVGRLAPMPVDPLVPFVHRMV